MGQTVLRTQIPDLESSSFPKDKDREAGRAAEGGVLRPSLAVPPLQVPVSPSSHPGCSEGKPGSPAPLHPAEVAAVTSAWPCFP